MISGSRLAISVPPLHPALPHNCHSYQHSQVGFILPFPLSTPTLHPVLTMFGTFAKLSPSQSLTTRDWVSLIAIEGIYYYYYYKSTRINNKRLKQPSVVFGHHPPPSSQKRADAALHRPCQSIILSFLSSPWERSHHWNILPSPCHCLGPCLL